MARRIGRRFRKGVVGTAVAAATMAALTASQAPGLAVGAPMPKVKVPPGPPIDGGSPFSTAMPPANSPSAPGTPGGRSGTGRGQGGVGGIPVGGAGIPATVLAAYKNAEATLRTTHSGCHLPWQLLAAIGQVESGQADGGNVNARGTTFSPILGPVLDGTNGYARIPATPVAYDDGNSAYARAVGPMQFIPSTWAVWGADGNGDGVKDPNNVFDAALAAGSYLCAAGGDLSIDADMRTAILGYNNSQAYLQTVLAWYEYFSKGGAAVVADGSGGASGGSGAPTAGASPSASRNSGRGAGSPHSGSSGSSGSARPQPTASSSGSGPGGGGSSSTGSPGSSSGGTSSSGSPSGSSTPSPSPSKSGSPSPSPSSSCSPKPSSSPSGSTSATPSPSPSPSSSSSPCGTSASPTPSSSSSASPSPSATG